MIKIPIDNLGAIFYHKYAGEKFMRSVFFEEMDLIWTRYETMIEKMGYVNFLEESEQNLQDYLCVDNTQFLINQKINIKSFQCLIDKTLKFNQLAKP